MRTHIEGKCKDDESNKFTYGLHFLIPNIINKKIIIISQIHGLQNKYVHRKALAC